MKKLLSLLGAVALSSSATAGFSQTIEIKKAVEQTSNQQDEENTSLNWKQVSLSLNEHFDNFKANNFSQMSSFGSLPISEIDQEKMAEIQQTANKLLERFQNENTSYEQIIATLGNETPEFKENYEEELNKNQQEYETSMVDNFSNGIGISEFGFISGAKKSAQFWKLKKKEIKTVSDQLQVATGSLAGISAGAAIAAAAFWPWAWMGWAAWCAAGCTIISAATAIGSVSTGTANFFLKSKLGELNGNDKFWEGFGELNGMVVGIFSSITKTIIAYKVSMIVISKTVATSSWTFSPGWIAVGAIAAIVVMIDAFTTF